MESCNLKPRTSCLPCSTIHKSYEVTYKVMSVSVEGCVGALSFVSSSSQPYSGPFIKNVEPDLSNALCKRTCLRSVHATPLSRALPVHHLQRLQPECTCTCTCRKASRMGVWSFGRWGHGVLSVRLYWRSRCEGGDGSLQRLPRHGAC